MCELTRSFTATDPLMVIPAVLAADRRSAPAGCGPAAGSDRRAARPPGEDDVATREYRHGDDLRRVHWRSTARHGELMVRREEQPRQMRATVLLDTRADGAPRRGPGLVVRVGGQRGRLRRRCISARQRYGVRVLTDATATIWTGPHSGESGALLDQLAVVRTGEADSLPAALRTLRRTGGDGLLIALLGEVGEDEAGALARVAQAGSPGLAILLRTTDWADLPTGTASTLDERRRRAGRSLQSAGWLLAEAGPRDGISEVWATATGQDPATGIVPLLQATGGRR